MNNQWIIVAGSMGGGFFFHGPFDSAEEAQEHATSNGFGTWEVSPLQAPHEADCPAVDGMGCRCGESI